jgi:iron-sulfur cluster insertion protein
MNTEQPTHPPQALVFTEHAADKVRQLSARQEQSDSMLRVYIQGGGCSGFQYGFALEAQENQDDMVVETDGVKLLVDPMSFQYLMGSEIDYLEDLQGARFVINNPNATTTCGCGASFGI